MCRVTRQVKGCLAIVTQQELVVFFFKLKWD